LRQQLKWLVAAGALLGCTFVVSIPLWTTSASWAGVAWTLLFSISTTAIPVATAFAILRYRLYEIDVIVRRTVSYAALLAVLAGIYLAGVALFGTLLRDVVGRTLYPSHVTLWLRSIGGES
jgi:hypothetical protein